MSLEDNSSGVTVFTLSGLNENMDYRYTLFFLTLLYYCLIILVNAALVVTIILDANLHTPMYIFLCNLCINGLYGTTGFYPKFLRDLLSYRHVISFAGSLVQIFVIYSSANYDFSILAVMAYDRYVAICRPLEYHSVMTKKRVALLVCFSWLTPFFCLTTGLFLTSRQRLCGSHIDKLFCENWSVVKLACSSTTVDNIVGYVVIIIFTGHVVFIVCTYVYLIRTCIGSIENRVKFMQTCVPHLLALNNILIALLFDTMYSRYGSRDLPQSLKNFMAIEFLIFPPILNPVIYGLKLTQIRKRILNTRRTNNRVKG